VTLDPTVIHANSTPAEVLAASLPIVEAAFAEPWSFDCLNPCGTRSKWAFVAASYLMGPLMRWQAADTELSRVHHSRSMTRSTPGELHRMRDAQKSTLEAMFALDAAALRLRDY